MTYAAFATATAQLIFLVNLFWSMKKGAKAPANPWNSTTLEWTIPSPPPFDNFAGVHPVGLPRRVRIQRSRRSHRFHHANRSAQGHGFRGLGHRYGYGSFTDSRFVQGPPPPVDPGWGVAGRRGWRFRRPCADRRASFTGLFRAAGRLHHGVRGHLPAAFVVRAVSPI